MRGAVKEALQVLSEARRRCEVLAEAGHTFAAHLVATLFSSIGNCLQKLGQLDEAVTAYEEAGRRAEELGQQRGLATAKMQLGTVLRRQRRYPESLAAFEEVLFALKGLSEPLTIAELWYHIGLVHQEAGHQEQAERAYRQSLAISVQQKNPAGEANSLNELGNLYDETERPEKAVECFRQAVDIYGKLRDGRKEGLARTNLANTLRKLGRYDEARSELLRGIQCNELYGDAAKPWITWDILHLLELSSGDAEAAALARQRAVESYLSYRREGGYSTTPATTELCNAVASAIDAKDISEIEQFLYQLLERDTAPQIKAVFQKLLAVLHGESDPTLASDPELDYGGAVELLLLLEKLQKG
jgi:tetratricopeptide (TPR) repeat protein